MNEPSAHSSSTVDHDSPVWDRRLLWLAGFLALVLLVQWDRAVMTAFLRIFNFPHLVPVANAVQMVAERPGLIAITAAILLLDRNHRKRALKLGTLLVIGALCVHLAKPLVGRVRPAEAMGENDFRGPTCGWLENDCQSFPSGHTAAAFASAGAICTWYPPLRVPALVLAVGTGSARVYHREHFFSDVLAGAMLGWFIGTRGAKWRWRMPLLY